MPLASATGGATERLDFYLLEDERDALALSALPPSAANRTTWTYRIPVAEDAVEHRVRLAFPAPDRVIDETAGVDGAVQARARLLSDGAITMDSYTKRLEVRLIEGERSVLLGDLRLRSAMNRLDFEGDYPGHGDGAAPHTHGPGNDAARPLHLADLEVELRFVVEWRGAVPPLDESIVEIGVEIDGKSFIGLDAVGGAGANGAAPAPAAAAPSESCEPGTSPSPTPNATKEPRPTANAQAKSKAQANAQAQGSADGHAKGSALFKGWSPGHATGSADAAAGATLKAAASIVAVALGTVGLCLFTLRRTPPPT